MAKQGGARQGVIERNTYNPEWGDGLSVFHCFTLSNQ